MFDNYIISNYWSQILILSFGAVYFLKYDFFANKTNLRAIHDFEHFHK